MSLLYPHTLRTFAQAPDLPASDRLTEAHIQTACDELGVDFATEDHHVLMTRPREIGRAALLAGTETGNWA